MGTLFWVSCGEGGGGGRGSPGGLQEITPEEYDKLIEVAEVPTGDRDAGEGGQPGAGAGGEEPLKEYRRAGFLREKGNADSFDVYAEHDEVKVVFEWPEGEADFWVKVYGEEGTELGDFDLDNGEIIRLLNGGKFTLEVYSREGGGPWVATYED